MEDKRRDILPALMVQKEAGVDLQTKAEKGEFLSGDASVSEDYMPVIQTSHYEEKDTPRINNNHFHEGKSNPLSSKGN